MKKLFLFGSMVFIMALSACSTQPAPVITSTPVPSTQASPSATATEPPTATPSPSPTPTLAPVKMCSPLQGLDISELPGIVSNPFQAPENGHDDGHHGVDLAFYRHGSLTTMLGLPIQSVFAGKVAAAITNRPPYGNFVIIETPLDGLDITHFPLQVLPTRAPTFQPASALNCPTAPDQFDPNSSQLSLYLLYAHMNHPTTLAVGDTVSCGQVISDVGTTGNSVNPHLHLETRIGPSSATFSAMAHYIANATNQEMHNYCQWRVSGVFQMFDPMVLFSENK